MPRKGRMKERRRLSHTEQMKVSECIIQEGGQGAFENIFKRTAGSLAAFNARAKYWKSFNRLEKLILIK